jgi:hypothetical protein
MSVEGRHADAVLQCLPVQEWKLGAEVEVPRKGLIIMADPLEKILSGTKSLELRKSRNLQSGPIALIQKGTGCVMGVAQVSEAISPMSWPEFEARAGEHGVESYRMRAVFGSGYFYGWPLSGVRRLRTPVAYRHRAGAVTWAALDEECVRRLGEQLER